MNRCDSTSLVKLGLSEDRKINIHPANKTSPLTQLSLALSTLARRGRRETQRGPGVARPRLHFWDACCLRNHTDDQMPLSLGTEAYRDDSGLVISESWDPRFGDHGVFIKPLFVVNISKSCLHTRRADKSTWDRVCSVDTPGDDSLRNTTQQGSPRRSALTLWEAHGPSEPAASAKRG